MIWYIIEVLNAVSEFVIICIYFNKLMKSNYVNTWLKTLVFLIAAIITAAISILSVKPISLLIITFLLLITLSLLFYDEKLSLKLFYSFIYVAIILIADPILVGFSYLLRGVSYNDLFQHGTGRIIGMIISKIMYF